MAADTITQDPDAIAEHVVSSLQRDNARESQRSPSHQQQSSSLLLTQLPTEILHNIVDLLRNRDIKKLRLSCKFFAHVAVLRLHRVFLSANPLNIQVFRAIADHEGYRHGVTELIYDDARLPRSPWEVNVARRMFLHRDGPEFDRVLSVMQWFADECYYNLESFGFGLQIPCQVAREEQANAQLTFEACLAYYEDLVRQQDEVLANNSDMEALLYGLERFSSLKTVIVTPAAHGYVFKPFYETPMIRAFPYGFNYYIPRGWPTRHAADGRPDSVMVDEPGPWVGEDKSLIEKIKSQWRGCLLAFRALAQVPNHHVSELLIDDNQLGTGLSCRMFDEPCDAYADLVSILEGPSLRRFHLSLLVDEQWFNGWSSFRSGLLRKALAKCVAMEDFALTTDMYDCGMETYDIFPPLATVIPIDCWPRLKHLKLWKLFVKKAEVIDFLALLPQTLRSVELSLLFFQDEEPGEDYFHLLSDMRSTLDWRERPIKPHIKIAVGETKHWSTEPTIATWLGKEIDEYFYGQGENPFLRDTDSHGAPNKLGVRRDALWPDFGPIR